MGAAALLAGAFLSWGCAGPAPSSGPSEDPSVLRPCDQVRLPFLDEASAEPLQELHAHCFNFMLEREGARPVPVQVVLLSDREADPLEGRQLLVYHPGGPSVSATRLMLGDPPPVDYQRYSVLAWDGFTARAAIGGCGPESLAFLTERTPQDFAQRAPRVTSECVGGYDSPLELGAWAAAEELETVRRMIGTDRFDMLAISYGTAIAEAYLHMHPERVRHAVLDGPLALEVSWPNRLTAVGPVLGRLADELARSCRTDACQSVLSEAGAGGSYDALRAAVLAEDRPVGSGTLLLRPVMFDQATALALRGRDYWPGWATAVDEALAGDGTLMWRIGERLLEDLDRDNFYWSLCADIDRPLDAAGYAGGPHPLLFAYASELAPCAGFPKGVSRPAGTAGQAAAVLILASRHDVLAPAALLSWSPRLQALGSACITDVVGHTSYRDEALRPVVEEFLATGDVGVMAEQCDFQ